MEINDPVFIDGASELLQSKGLVITPRFADGESLLIHHDYDDSIVSRAAVQFFWGI